MRTTKFLIAAILLLVFILQGCNNQPRKVKVGYLPMVSSLTHFVAENQGYYNEEGIEIEANPIKTSDLIAQDLVAGHTNVAIELSIVPLLRQNESAPNATKVFSVSKITGENGFDGIVVKNDSPYETLEDLSGKKIGVFPGSTAKNSLKEIFVKQFPDLTLPEFVVIDPSLHLQSLESNDVDALFAYEPSLTIGIVKYNFRKISNSIYAIQYPSNPIGVAAINTKWLIENPKLANSFVKAIDRAVLFIKEHPQEARKILAEATNLEPDVIERINIMPMSLSTEIDPIHLQGYLKLLKDINEINTVPNAESFIYK